MLVKFFPNKQGGGTGSVYYLLNDRVEQGTAKILQGDKNQTIQLINQIPYKQKVTFGSLNFTERDIPQEIKLEIIAEFERVLLAGLERDKNYKILWVEHTDKQNLELNFVIPRIELESLKSLTPYYYKADQNRIDAFKDIINLKYGFTDPNDPSREQPIKASKKKKRLYKNLEDVENQLKLDVISGFLTSRDEIINHLRENGIEVTREGKDCISIKMPEAKKATKLTGAIYDERFTSLKSLEGIFREKERRAIEYKERTPAAKRAILNKLQERLTRAYEHKFRDNQQKYGLSKRSAGADENKSNQLSAKDTAANLRPTTTRKPNTTTSSKSQRNREESGAIRHNIKQWTMDDNLDNSWWHRRIFLDNFLFKIKQQRQKNELRTRIIASIRARTQAAARANREYDERIQRIRETNSRILREEAARSNRPNLYGTAGIRQRFERIIQDIKSNISGTEKGQRQRTSRLLEDNQSIIGEFAVFIKREYERATELFKRTCEQIGLKIRYKELMQELRQTIKEIPQTDPEIESLKREAKKEQERPRSSMRFRM